MNSVVMTLFTLPENKRYLHPSGKIKKGFTLSEVLITLGIIGVIASIVLLSLIGIYQKKAHAAQMKQTYAQLSNAFKNYMIQNDTNDLRTLDLQSYEGVNKFMHSHFRITTYCLDNGTNMAPCFPEDEPYKALKGNIVQKKYFWPSNWSTRSYCYALANSVSICLERLFMPRDSTGIPRTDPNHPYYGHIIVDVNGHRGPNVLGRDFFTMEYYRDGSIDDAGITPECRKDNSKCQNGLSPREERELLFQNHCNKKNSTGGANGCFGKLYNDGWEMKY